MLAVQSSRVNAAITARKLGDQQFRSNGPTVLDERSRAGRFQSALYKAEAVLQGQG